MGWSHPDISLDDLLKLIKGFVDILILASGYQSSGCLAHWDSENIKKAFQWGLFFETVFRRLSCSDDYQDSVEELDASLSKMKNDPYFPQGLAHISSATLCRARGFVLEHFVHALPLTDMHLRHLVTAAIEMDLDELLAAENDCLHAYLDKLMVQTTSLNPVLDGRRFMEDASLSSADIIVNKEADNCRDGDFSTCTIQELLRRQSAVSCISSAETSLDVLSKAMSQSKCIETAYSLRKELSKKTTSYMNKDQFIEPLMWSQWRMRGLSYLLNKRTIRLVSGASMIFSAPKVQWVQVFERLNNSVETNEDGLFQTIELLLLGLAASRWSSLIGHLISVSYDSLTISMLYHEVCNICLKRFQNSSFKAELMNAEEKCIIGYLEILLSSQLRNLWKLSPILAAMAIPSGSQLFRLYLGELESLYKGDSSTFRCCSCIRGGKDHRECEVAERLWCLYIFHVHGLHKICVKDAAS